MSSGVFESAQSRILRFAKVINVKVEGIRCLVGVRRRREGGCDLPTLVDQVLLRGNQRRGLIDWSRGDGHGRKTADGNGVVVELSCVFSVFRRSHVFVRPWGVGSDEGGSLMLFR